MFSSRFLSRDIWLFLGIVGFSAGACLSNPAGANGVAFAHMANTSDAVDWAVRVGANGVEVDLRFSNDGQPKEFRHGGVCDCSCVAGGRCLLAGTCPEGNICAALWKSGSSCNAKSDPIELAASFAGHPDKLAVVYIDSKVDTGTVDLTAAGQNVIRLLDEHAFDRGYVGQFIISTPDISQIEYTKSAVEAAEKSANKMSYFFTFDNEGNNYDDVLARLITMTKNRGFSTGISACASGDYSSSIKSSHRDQQKGVIAFTSIWTLDRPNSIKEYLGFGASSIMSNYPSRVVEAMTEAGVTLAKPGSAFTPAKSNDVKTIEE